VVDRETGALFAVVVYLANVADPASVEANLARSDANLTVARRDDPTTPATKPDPMRRAHPTRKAVTDKGYHKATLLRRLKSQHYRTYIPKGRQGGTRRWTHKAGRPPHPLSTRPYAEHASWPTGTTAS